MWFILSPEHNTFLPDIVGVSNIYVEINLQTPNYQSPQILFSFRGIFMYYCENSSVVFIWKKNDQKWNIGPETGVKLYESNFGT